MLSGSLTDYEGSYAVAWKRRCNHVIDKMKVIDGLATKVCIDSRMHLGMREPMLEYVHAGARPWQCASMCRLVARSLSRCDQVKEIAPKATVSLNDANAAVVSDVIKSTCCLAVLPRWKEFHGYNFRTVSGGEVPAAEMKPPKAANDATPNGAGIADAGQADVK